MHVSLDGFVTGPNGEMDWIIHTEEEQNYVTNLLNTVDTVLFWTCDLSSDGKLLADCTRASRLV